MSTKEKESKNQKKIPAEAEHPQKVSGNHELEALQKKLGEVQEEAAEYKENLLRKAAEFENYKRRMTAEFSSVVRNASENLIHDLLPILDDLNRFLKSSGESAEKNNPATLRQGIELIQSKLNSLLSQRGLQPFDSIGKPFDVEIHDAFLQMPRDDVPPNTVIEEVSRGYRLNDKILRHAKVVVSARASQADPHNQDPDVAGPGTDDSAS